MTITDGIALLVTGVDLSRGQTERIMEAIMDGEATPAQIAGFLVALKCKGEVVDEIAGAATVMRQKATPIPHNQTIVVDTCGTGGDHSGSFNISTTAAFVVAGAGVAVAKHGNRSITSACGSADVLVELGVNIDLSPEKVGGCIDNVGIGFLFATALHSAMKYAVPVRKELAPTPTIFNMLGPLTNPAGSKHQVIGVYSEALVEPIAQVLGELGGERGFVVHGSDGLDEITITGSSTVAELKDGKVSVYSVNPADFGITIASAKEIKGGDAKVNARITQAVLTGEAGPKRDVVLINAAAALVAGEVAIDLEQGLQKARQSIESGSAAMVLEKLKEVSNE